MVTTSRLVYNFIIRQRYRQSITPTKSIWSLVFFQKIRRLVEPALYTHRTQFWNFCSLSVIFPGPLIKALTAPSLYTHIELSGQCYPTILPVLMTMSPDHYEKDQCCMSLCFFLEPLSWHGYISKWYQCDTCRVLPLQEVYRRPPPLMRPDFQSLWVAA